MDIIDFFRSIDGVTYYVILVVNTILIFAIIGYLGEKNNEKYVKINDNIGEQLPQSNFNFNDSNNESHSTMNIPTVSATMVNNSNHMGNNNLSNQDSNLNNFNSVSGVTAGINSSNAIADMNEIDPNEKAPAVLIINSDNTNMPK